MSAPNSNVTVRRAGRTDVDRVVPLFGAYREFYRQPRDPNRERQFLLDRMARQECAVFVAESRGEVVGFTLLYPMFTSIGLRPTWVLNDLYVIPARRRGGVGARLLTRAREFGRDTNAEYLTLETARDNPAQRLYEAEGWRKDELFLHYELPL
ncbi:MAG: GNAT family N-acetyltransferase [Thermoplasmata archaeon]